MSAEILIWVFAIITTLVGVASAIHFTYIALFWSKAMGQVMGNSHQKGDDDEGSYVAEINFMANDGKIYKINSDVGHTKPWKIGTRILVHYKPANPNHAMTMTLLERAIFSGAFIAVAVACWGAILGVIDGGYRFN